jgi:UrcA family protein
MRIILLTTLCLATGLASHTGQAAARQDGPAPVSATVKVSDLDLTQAKGARQMLLRISRASHEVCSKAANDYGPLSISTRDYLACVRQARSRAVADLDNGAVTALYRNRDPVEVARE